MTISPVSIPRYEKCMVAATRAYCECNLAARELEAPGVGDEASKRALAFLKSAAALFNSIAGQLLPLKESLPVSRAPEVTPQYNLGLAQLCRCAHHGTFTAVRTASAVVHGTNC